MRTIVKSCLITYKYFKIYTEVTSGLKSVYREGSGSKVPGTVAREIVVCFASKSLPAEYF